MDVASQYWAPRFLFQRGLGFIYFIAFLIAINQFRPLLGEHGLLPVPLFVKQVPFRASPSLFYLFPNDRAFAIAAWLGLALSCLGAHGPFRPLQPLVLHAGVGHALGHLSFLRECGPDLLRLRLGINAARSRLPRDFSGQQPHRAARHPDLAPALDGVPRDVRRRPHQAARRPLLAQPHLSRLPLRDPAHAESAELVFPLDARLDASRRRLFNHFVELVVPFGLFPAAADRHHRRRVHHRLPVAADPQRQSFVPELAHHRAGDSHARRPHPVRAPADSRSGAPACAARL